ncbi:TetR/AcrR family transcriptional regulator [Streptomyces sp. NPDC102360]|uniref:TetR/AcrR family transcriptional regulator n=1 Tax=Streptomyces sp. NPDC102360 TaxID=3366160 RepID=UPI0038218970
MTPTAGSSASSPKTAGRRRAGGTYAAADARREAILDAATTAFAQAGYGSSSLARIAADAGTSATVVVHHFGSKERLLVAVLEQHEAVTRDRTIALETAGLLNSLAALRDLKLETATYNLAHPGRLQLFVQLSAEAGNPAHPAHERFRRRYVENRAAHERCLRAAIASGEIRDDVNVRSVAREIPAVSDGLQVQWALEPDSIDLHAELNSYFDRLSRALSPDGRTLPPPTELPQV